MKTKLAFAIANPAYILAVTISCGFALLALTISCAHQINLAHHYGVPSSQAWTAPVFVDGFMILGRLGQFSRFDAATNRLGRAFMIVSALGSLAANILNGTTVGYRVFGALIVTGFIAAEFYATRMRPAPPKVSVEEQEALDVHERRSEASRRGHALRKERLAAEAAAKAAKKRPSPAHSAASLHVVA